jgi:hypothetical protein
MAPNARNGVAVAVFATRRKLTGDETQVEAFARGGPGSLPAASAREQQSEYSFKSFGAKSATQLGAGYSSSPKRSIGFFLRAAAAGCFCAAAALV